MALRPLNDVIVVQLEDDQWMWMKKPELIEIPEAFIGGYKKRSQWGRVISWGNKCTYKYRSGDRVYFRWSDSRPGFKLDGKDFRMVQEQELLAKDEDAGS